VALQSVTNFMMRYLTSQVAPRAGAKIELRFNKPASGKGETGEFYHILRVRIKTFFFFSLSSSEVKKDGGHDGKEGELEFSQLLAKEKKRSLENSNPGNEPDEKP